MSDAQTVVLKLTAAVVIDGQIRKAGTKVEMVEDEAKTLLRLGKAELVTAPAAAPTPAATQVAAAQAAAEAKPVAPVVAPAPVAAAPVAPAAAAPAVAPAEPVALAAK